MNQKLNEIRSVLDTAWSVYCKVDEIHVHEAQEQLIVQLDSPHEHLIINVILIEVEVDLLKSEPLGRLRNPKKYYSGEFTSLYYYSRRGSKKLRCESLQKGRNIEIAHTHDGVFVHIEDSELDFWEVELVDLSSPRTNRRRKSNS